MGVGELFEMCDTPGLDCGEMCETNFKRSAGRSPAIESERKGTVFAGLHHLVGDCREVHHIQREWAENIGGYLGQPTIATTVRSASRLDPIGIPDQQSKGTAISGSKRIIESPQHVCRFHVTPHFPV